MLPCPGTWCRCKDVLNVWNVTSSYTYVTSSYTYVTSSYTAQGRPERLDTYQEKEKEKENKNQLK